MPTATRVLASLLAILCLQTTARCVDNSDRTSPPLPTLQYHRWSGSINVPDPVAISVDSQGRVFVTQTRRRKIQDLDIREHREWIADDVGLTSVAEKRAFLRAQLAIGGPQQRQSKQVADHNGDGFYDWRDLRVVSECIYRLVDSNDDGTADQITFFAEDFKTEVTGIAAGVLAHQDDVWATIAPDLWRLTDSDDDGVADQRIPVVSGFGLHIAYGGHDMHGLAIGPDGKVYWSIGDKGINVTTVDGRNIRYPNQGGVMRCNRDGTDFEVFAHGLRNVQEIAFDQYGNLFGVDNDADLPNEQERFVWIVDAMDAGWRCNYQYRGSSYNPWTDEKLWQLPADKHPAYIVPPLGYSIDGPAGFKFNPGTALSPEYKDYFFLTGAPNGNQHAFRVESVGDAFQMVDERKIGSGVAIVGLSFGPDGALYGADWDGGYPLDQKGSVVSIDVPDAAKSVVRLAVKRMLADGFANRSVSELVGLLAHDDQRVRLGAQFALVDRHQTEQASKIANDPTADRLARLHGIWALGQLARGGDHVARESLLGLAEDRDPILRSQFAKTYGELADADAGNLLDLVTDEDPHVRVHAGLAIARHGFPGALPTLFSQADDLQPDQHYLRHSLVMALAASANPMALVEQCDHPSVMRRLCAVLALRHQANPGVSEYLDDDSSWVAAEAARAIHDDQSIPDAIGALAECLENAVHRGVATDRGEAFLRRAINANFRIGSAEAATRLMQFAMNESQPTALRVDACQALAQWNRPPLLDRVEGRRRDLPVDTRSIDRDFLQASFAELAIRGSAELRVAAVVAARSLELPLSATALTALIQAGNTPVDLRIESLNTLAETSSDSRESILRAAADSHQAKLAARAIQLIVQHYPESAFSILSEKIAAGPRDKRSSSPVLVKQVSIAGLAELQTAQADHLLQTLADQVVGESLDPRLALDVLQAMRERERDSTLLHHHELLVRQGAVEASEDPGLKKFRFSRDGGDAAAGEVLFRSHVQAQCSRCHRIGRGGSEIGPELTKIAGKRDADYLLRSIALPSADIEPKYLTQVLLLDSGQVVKGVITRQDDEQTIVVNSEGKELKIGSDEIEAVSLQNVSLMPDMTEVLSPREVRDLVAYLTTLK